MKKILQIIFLLTLISSCTTSEKVTKTPLTRVIIEENEADKTLSLTFQFIAAIGSLATVGSFIFLFRRDKDKQSQIDKLTNLVSALKDLKDIENKKLNLSIRPDIKLNGSGYNGTDGELTIDIENIGHKATLIKFDLKSDDLILHNEHLPFVMENNTTRKIFARTNGVKHIKDCEYEIQIHHLDRLGNLHISIIQGIGIRNTLKETKYNC